MEFWNIKIFSTPLTVGQLRMLAEQSFGDMVKGVVDIDQGLIALGGELHADEEAVLLQQGSKQENLWGINLYPDKAFPEMVEFNSMINIRPSQNNRSRYVEDEKVRTQILETVEKLIQFI